MTQVLLDTHVFLWFVSNDPRLTRKAARVIAAPDPQKLLSVVSLWEIAIKAQIGKITLGMPFTEFVEHYVDGVSLTVLPITLGHLQTYSELPLKHRDPFDRLLVAQAMSLGVPLVSGDAALGRYGVKVLW